MEIKKDVRKTSTCHVALALYAINSCLGEVVDETREQQSEANLDRKISVSFVELPCGLGERFSDRFVF